MEEEEEEVCLCLIVVPLSPLEKNKLFHPKGMDKTAKGENRDLAFKKRSAVRLARIVGECVGYLAEESGEDKNNVS